VKGVGIQRDTVVACAAAAVLAAVGAAAAGHLAVGLGLAAGLVIGAFNAYAVASVLERRIPFVAGTLVRLVFFSATAMVAALLIGFEAWSVLLGVGAAQLVMVAASVRRAVRP
jgi:O-antigen/teichoic acid export membrane protein